jgi:hypothetical protein
MEHDLVKLYERSGIFGIITLAVAILVAILLFALFVRLQRKQLNARAFISQINRLVDAKNVDRAQKLLSVAGDGPVARLVRVGLNAWISNPAATTTHEERAARAREDIAMNAQNALRPLLVSLVPAQLLGVMTIALLTLSFHHQPYLNGMLVGDVTLAALVLGTHLAGRKLRADVAYLVGHFGVTHPHS